MQRNNRRWCTATCCRLCSCIHSGLWSWGMSLTSTTWQYYCHLRGFNNS